GGRAWAVSRGAGAALAASLRGELLADGVGVVLVSPGFVESEIRRVDNRGVHHPDADDPVPRWLVVPVARAAQVIVRAIARRRREGIVTGHGQVAFWLSPWIAERTDHVASRSAVVDAYRLRPNGTRSSLTISGSVRSSFRVRPRAVWPPTTRARQE